MIFAHRQFHRLHGAGGELHAKHQHQGFALGRTVLLVQL